MSGSRSLTTAADGARLPQAVEPDGSLLNFVALAVKDPAIDVAKLDALLASAPARDASGRHIKSLIGSTFGRLLVIGFHGKLGGKFVWNCLCQCGRIAIAKTNNLNRGGVRSCGCLKAESVKKKRAGYPIKHGGSEWPEYRVWNAMRGRCGNPRDQNYKYYGARGIRVCPEWALFENFIRDMGRRSGRNLQIERTDNDGDYEPDNCRWATPAEQNRNKRPWGAASIASHRE